MLKIRRRPQNDPELDITAFLNLMIVLVPVLLLGLVFSQITVLDIKLPDLASDSSTTPDNQQVELVIREQGLVVNYPRGIQLKAIPLTQQGEQNFEYLTQVLREVKRQLREKQIEKRAISILSEPQTPYQTIVSVIDRVRSFKTVVATSVVDAELFPEISFGDAPQLAANNIFAGGGQ